MKKITFLLFALVAFTWQSNAQFTEGFDTEIPATWTILNEDGGTYTWNHQTQYPQAGAGHARIQWEGAAHNDFLITPQFTVTANVSDRISFFAGIDGTFWTETFDVRVSTTGTTAGDFTTIASETATTDADGDYTQYTYDISAYNGMDVYVAIVATDTDRYYLYVDEFVNDGLPTCTPGEATATIIEDCDASTYTIEVVVSTVGDATIVTDGVTPQAFVGTVSFGPYAFGVDTTLNVEHSDVACDFTLGVYSFVACPPANDNCATAENLVPSTTGAEVWTSGTTLANTASGEISDTDTGCFGFGAGRDVWYTVQVPLSGEITIETRSVSGSPLVDTVMSIFSGTCGAIAGTEIECDDDDSPDGNFSLVSLTGQTPGDILYVRVWEYGNPAARGPEDGPFEISAHAADPALSTQNFDINSAFTYYPNPVNNTLTLKGQKDIQNVAVYNMLGQEVIRTAPNTVNSDLDMSNLQPGAYFVKVTIENTTKTIKVIKK